MTAIVFANLCAGGGKAARRMAEVRAAFARQGYAAEFVTPGSAEELRAAVRHAICSGARTLIGLGGDGTLQLLVREAFDCPVSFGVIPLGGGNDFAAALGMRSWEQAVNAIVGGGLRAVDVVRVKFANGEHAMYLGGGGIGLDAEAARLASGRFMKWPGRLRYLAAALTALRKYEAVSVIAELPGSMTAQLSRRVLLAAVLNTPSYGGGLRLAPDARIDDGMLDFVSISELSSGEVMRVLLWLTISGELRTDRQQRLRARSLKLDGTAGTLFHGDGEILGSVPVEIEVAEQAVRFFVPHAEHRRAKGPRR